MNNTYKIRGPICTSNKFIEIREWIYDTFELTDFIFGNGFDGIKDCPIIGFKYEKDAILYALRWL